MIEIVVPKGEARTLKLTEGARFRIVNEYGGQVVDTWAFNTLDLSESLSMAHSRSALYRLEFSPGDTLMSNHFRPIIDFTVDTSPGHHDTLHAACSKGSYQFYEGKRDHPNCQDNLLGELAKLNYFPDTIPSPWNLFEYTHVDEDLNLQDRPSVAKQGDYVELRALMGVFLICSACPSTVGGISGASPKGAKIVVRD